jgi:shikimate kinase
MKKILLIGYMGSGKSTVAKIIASKLQLEFVDLDNLIEERESLSINDLFTQKGEIYFRKLEHQILNEVLDTKSNFVFSLGGGTPCYANNHISLQREDVSSFYLKTSIVELYERLSKNKSKRPIIANLDGAELQEFIAKHLFDRSFFYYQAKHIVATDNKSNDEVANEICNILI